MISVTTFCTTLRISGPVEKTPSTGPAALSRASTDLPSPARTRYLGVGEVGVELAVVGQPHQDRAEHGAEDLSAEVHGDVAPLGAALDRETQGHRGVEVGAGERAEM